MEAKGPVGVNNTNRKEKTKARIRHGPVIMTINAGSLPIKKAVLELYSNGREIHVIVVIETNVTESRLPLVQMAN